MSERNHSVAIIGAGIIGLSCAWEMSRRGASVTIIDRAQPGSGASTAAAGMLGARYEFAMDQNAHPQLLDLSLRSSELWPAYIDDLQTDPSNSLRYSDDHTFALADEPGDEAALQTIAKRLSERGVDVEIVEAGALQALQPSLSHEIAGAVRIIGEGQVDNRAVVAALLAACHANGIKIINHTPANALDLALFDSVLWAVGASEDMGPLGVKPVKGSAFSIRPDRDLPTSIIRFANHYIVPKKDRVIVGATIEPGVRHDEPDAAQLDRLRTHAVRICPAIASAPIRSTWSGLRPATPDRAPLLGQLPDGRFIATGHYRNGILLAPITAQIMADMILQRKTGELAAAFAPDRFATATH